MAQAQSSPSMVTQLEAIENSGAHCPQDGPTTKSCSKGVTVPLMKVSFTEHASSVGEVSAFVHAVVDRVIPKQFFGGVENQKAITKHVDRFLRLRRFEMLSLHDVIQGLKVYCVLWWPLREANMSRSKNSPGLCLMEWIPD